MQSADKLCKAATAAQSAKSSGPSEPYVKEEVRAEGRGSRGGLRLLHVLQAAAGILLSTLAVPAASAGLPVFDSSNLTEMVVQKIATIEQWGIDNQKQIEQLQQLMRANELTAVNSALNQQGSWAAVGSVFDASLTQIYAVQSLWREYEKAADFFSSLKTTEAWLYCLKQGSSCSFDRYFKLIDENVITQSQGAAQNAQQMQQNLQRKAELLKTLKSEAVTVEGHADLLDNLSRINAETASSLIDLNSQSAQLIELISRDQLNEAAARQALQARQEAFADKGDYPGETHVDLTLPTSFK